HSWTASSEFSPATRYGERFTTVEVCHAENQKMTRVEGEPINKESGPPVRTERRPTAGHQLARVPGGRQTWAAVPPVDTTDACSRRAPQNSALSAISTCGGSRLGCLSWPSCCSASP